MMRNTHTSLYTWVIDAIDSGLDGETIIRVYVYDGKDKLVTKGTSGDIFKECRIDDDLSGAIIHNWYAWAKDDIVINLDKESYDYDD